jgi:hypothetical protein
MVGERDRRGMVSFTVHTEHLRSKAGLAEKPEMDCQRIEYYKSIKYQEQGTLRKTDSSHTMSGKRRSATRRSYRTRGTPFTNRLAPSRPSQRHGASNFHPPSP